MTKFHIEPSSSRIITKIIDGKAEQLEDQLIGEYPLTLCINGDEWITLLASRGAEAYLAIGFLYSEGLIKQIDEIADLQIDLESGRIDICTNIKTDIQAGLKGKRTVTTGCGKGTVFYDVLDALTAKPINDHFMISSQTILQLSVEFNQKSKLFRETGGVHACALCDSSIRIFHEDIGRHNALDKVIGHCLSENLPTKGKWLLTSGRLSSEIVIKSAKNNIALLVSRSAPTNLAVELADSLNMTLIGFARSNRMNIYTGAQRVLIQGKE